MNYYHRQFSFVIIAILAIGIAANVIFIFAPELLPQQLKSIETLYQVGIDSWEYYAYAINLLILLIMINFSSMAVTVEKQKVSWSFLLKVPSKSILIKNIASVSVVKNSWWNGWGARKISKGWLYNVSGLDAIEIIETSGKLTRIGSNDVKNLSRKLEKLCNNSNTRGDHNG